MKRLGEILLARGALSKDQLRSGLTACRRNGGKLGTWLVRLGHIKEATLLTALAEQTGCPSAGALELAAAPTDVRGLLHPTFARRHVVVPFARHGRTLDVAMDNPNDLVLVDEIARVTGLAVRPHVATEGALAAALAVPLSVPGGAATAPAPGPPVAATREWRQFWRLEASAEDLTQVLAAEPAPAPSVTSSAFPSLAPLDEAAGGPGPSELGELATALSTAGSREDVAHHLLGFLHPLAARVALLSLHQGRIMAWAARGWGIVPEDFNTLMLPVDQPSVLLNLREGVDVHVGPLSEAGGNVVLLDAMGAPRAREAVAAPIRVRNKVVAFVWLDEGAGSVAAIPLATVREAARLAGLALEVVVLRQKIRAAGRLTESRLAH